MEEKNPTYKELLHYYHSTVGLWAIDRNPQEVNFDWVCKNTFRLGIDEETLDSHRVNNLKPFDLEAAKAGKPVYTRDGRKARIICFDMNSFNNHIIVALITEENGTESIYSYTSEGKWKETETENDLMMLPEKKEGWILLRKGGSVFDNKEVAKKNCTDEYFAAKVEWEE